MEYYTVRCTYCLISDIETVPRYRSSGLLRCTSGHVLEITDHLEMMCVLDHRLLLVMDDHDEISLSSCECGAVSRWQ